MGCFGDKWSRASAKWATRPMCTILSRQARAIPNPPTDLLPISQAASVRSHYHRSQKAAVSKSQVLARISTKVTAIPLSRYCPVKEVPHERTPEMVLEPRKKGRLPWRAAGTLFPGIDGAGSRCEADIHFCFCSDWTQKRAD